MPALATHNSDPRKLAQKTWSRDRAPIQNNALGVPSTNPTLSIQNCIAAREVATVMKRQNPSNNKSILHFFKTAPRSSQESITGTVLYLP